MKILLYTDVHFSTYSSIIRSRTKRFSKRLEGVIESVGWAENLALIKGCDKVICLGDFFDKPELNAEEITALQEIDWSYELEHYFIVGNHESNINGLLFNSIKAVEAPNFNIVSDVKWLFEGDTVILFLPYIIEEDRQPLKYYIDTMLKKVDMNGRKLIIMSHNDIKGIRYGAYESTSGFTVEEIEKECNLFLNGHLHNGTQFCKNGINLGNLTGQNFSEDASKHNHCAFILDTDTLNIDYFENPHAFNFYKFQVDKVEDTSKLMNLKNNAVVTVKCEESLVYMVNEKLKELPNVVEHKVISYRKLIEDGEVSTNTVELNSVDHLNLFSTFIIEKLGKDKIVLDELNQVIGG